MRHITFLLMMPLLTMGCGDPAAQWEGIWYLEIPVLPTDACELDINENYEEASPPDDIGDSDWTFTDAQELSPSAIFLQVLTGDKGNVFVVIDNVIYPGKADKESLVVQWEGTADDTYMEEHDEGYIYQHDTVGDFVETITLIPQKELGGVTGDYQVSSTTIESWSETDRWPQNQVGVYGSQVPSFTYLTGNNPDNIPGDVDCAGDDCDLSVETSCDGKVDLTGLFAGKHQEGMFAGVEDASRPPGI